MGAINSSNYPNTTTQALNKQPTPPPASTETTPPTEEANTSSSEVSQNPEASATTQTGSENSTPPDLVISKEMAETLSSTQVQNLIDGILADGTVDKLDDAQLKQLNILLKAAAEKDDNKISGEEDSLIDALDSRGMFGTNREVVKANLEALKGLRAHEGEANTLSFGNGSIQVTTQDGVSGFFGGKQIRSLRMEMENSEGQAPTENTTPGNNTVTNLPDVLPETSGGVCVSPTLQEQQITHDARAEFFEESITRNTQNQEQLKSDVHQLREAINTRIPDDVIKTEMRNVVDNSAEEGTNLDHVLTQAKSWGVEIPEDIQNNPEAIKAFLSDYNFTDAHVAQYKSNLNQVIDNALNSKPLTGSALQELSHKLYDTNYLFENAENVSEADHQLYSRFKTELKNYQDSEKSLREINLDKPVTTGDLSRENGNLQRYDDRAKSELSQAVQDIDDLLKTIDANPDKFNKAETQSVRDDLKEIVQIDEQGNMVRDANGKLQIKEPVTQAHLDTLNKLWASVEAVGMEAGLDKEPGQIASDFISDLKNSGAPQDIKLINDLQNTPAGELFVMKPELAQYADLLKQLDQPGNEALKAALFGQGDPKSNVDSLLASHNTAVYEEFMNGLKDFSLFGFNPASMLGNTFTNVKNAFSSQLSLNTDMSTMSSLQSPLLSTELASPDLDLQIPPQNQRLNLGDFSTQDVKNLLQLVQGDSSESQLLRSKLAESSSQLGEVLSDPRLGGLQTQLAAKEQFDETFWGSYSQLDQARSSIQTSLSTQTKIGADLAVVEAQLQNTLEQAPDDVKPNLEAQLKIVQDARQQLANTGRLAEGDIPPQLQSALDSVRNSGTATLTSASDNLVGAVRKEQALTSIQDINNKLTEIRNNPEKKEQLISQFPTEQQAKIRNLLDNYELLDKMQQQVLADSNAISPEVLQSFQGVGEIIRLAEAGDKEALAQVGNMKVPGANMTLFDGVDHMDRLLKHVNSFEGDIEVKAAYAQGLMSYFNAEFENQASVSDAWNKFETGEMQNPEGKSVSVKSAVQAQILAGVEKEYGSGLTEDNAFYAEKQAALTQYIRNQASQNNSLLESVRGNNNSIRSYGDLAKTNHSTSDYEEILNNISSQLRNLDTDDPKYQDKKTQLEDLQSAVNNARTLSIRSNTIQTATETGMVDKMNAFITSSAQEVVNTSKSNETFLTQNKSAIDAIVPNGTQAIQRFLGSGAITPEKVAELEATMAPLKEQNIELYHQMMLEVNNSAFATSQYEISRQIGQGQGRNGIGEQFAFGQLVIAGGKALTSMSPPTSAALSEWNAIIIKYGLQAVSGDLKSTEMLADISAFKRRHRIQNSELNQLIGGGFRRNALSAENLNTTASGLSDNEREGIDKNITVQNRRVDVAKAAVASDTYTVTLALENDPSEDPDFEALINTAETNRESTPPEQHLAGALSANEIVTQNLTDVYQLAEVTGDFSLADRMRDATNMSYDDILGGYDDIFTQMSQASGVSYTPISEEYTGNTAVQIAASHTAADQKAAELVDKANALADRLVLAPEGENSEEFLMELINGFIDTIRDQDYKTRQLVLAQLANQMMTDSITNFYKDKTDKNNKYHQDSIARMAESFQRNIQRTIQESLVSQASDGQSIAAVSGQVGAANTAEAMGLEQLRASSEQLLSEAQKMTPPLITDLQKEKILESLFDNNPNNDALGIIALAGLRVN